MMRKKILALISIVIIVVLIFLIFIAKPWPSNKDETLLKRLKNNPSLKVNQDFIKSKDDTGHKYEGEFPIVIYSWDTKYGRIYSNGYNPPLNGEHTGFSHGGSTFFDAYGEPLTGCGDAYGKDNGNNGVMCEKFFNKLDARDANYSFLKNLRE